MKVIFASERTEERKSKIVAERTEIIRVTRRTYCPELLVACLLPPLTLDLLPPLVAAM
jgi:hypothetical protein